MFKFGNKKRFWLALSLVVMLMTLMACSGTQHQYNGKGASTVRITMDRQYEDINVSSPGAQITSEGNSYTLLFGNRAEKDIIITSPGYETLTLNVSTAQLSNGTHILKGISLSPAKVMLTITLQGVSSAEGLTVTSSNPNEDGVEGFTADKNKLTVQLKNLADTTLKISGEDIKDNVFPVFIQQFFNYKASIRLPILSKDDSRVALSVYNDIPVPPEHTYELSLFDYFYQDAVQRSNHTVSSTFYLKAGQNYTIGEDYSNNQRYLISNKTIENAIKYNNSYIYVPISAISLRGRTATALSVSEEVENFQNIFFNNRYVVNLIDKASGNYINYSSYYEDYTHKERYMAHDLYEGQQIIVSIFKFDSSFSHRDAFIYYIHTVTRQELTQGLVIQNRQDFTKLDVNFVDEDGQPFVPGEMLSITRNIHGETQEGEEIDAMEIYAEGDGFSVQIDEFLLNKNDSIMLELSSESGYEFDLSWIHFDALYSGSVNAMFFKKKTVRLSFMDIEGNLVDPYDVIAHYDGSLREGEDYIEFENVYDSRHGLQFYTTDQYLSNSGRGFIFNKEVFDYVEDGDYYKATIPVYRVKTVLIKIDFGRFGTVFQHIQVGVNESWFQLSPDMIAEGIEVVVDERNTQIMIDINAYGSQGNTHYQANERMTISDTFSELQEEYTITARVFQYN